jgi:hypothetical protein
MQQQSNDPFANTDPFFRTLFGWCGQNWWLYSAALLALGAAALTVTLLFIVGVITVATQFNLNSVLVFGLATFGVLGLSMGGLALAYRLGWIKPVHGSRTDGSA